jgi:tetratricopeptide (TPR) repeat protein
MMNKWKVLVTALGCAGVVYAQTAVEAGWREELLEVARLQQQGAYAQAQKLSVRLIREIQDSGVEGHDLAAALNALALVDADLGDFSSAEHLLLRAKRIWEKAGDQYRGPLDRCVGNLVCIYLERGERVKAERLLRSRVSAAPPSADADGARLLHLLAVLYYEQGRYHEGIPLEERAIQLWQARSGPPDAAFAAMLNELALLYERTGRTDEALRHFERSLEVLSKAPDPVLMTKALVSIATVHARARCYDNARALISRARATIEQTLGPQHPLLITVLRNEAVVLRRLGRKAEAKQVSERDHSVRNAIDGSTRAARCAGQKHAMAPASSMTALTAANALGSNAATSLI